MADDVLELDWPAPPVGQATHAQVHALVAGVAALGGAVGWLEVPGPDEVRRWLDGVLDSGARLLLARNAGALVGCGYWVRRPEAVHRHNAQLRKVMTAPAARGRGVARRIVAELVDDAQRAGVEVLTLTARGNNHGALRLYRDLGFTVTGRVPDALAVGHDRFDEVIMHQDLRLRRGGPDDLVRHGSRREGVGST